MTSSTYWIVSTSLLALLLEAGGTSLKPAAFAQRGDRGQAEGAEEQGEGRGEGRRGRRGGGRGGFEGRFGEGFQRASGEGFRPGGGRGGEGQFQRGEVPLQRGAGNAERRPGGGPFPGRGMRGAGEQGEARRGRGGEGGQEQEERGLATRPGADAAPLDMRRYASSLVSQFDKDGDRMLKGDELSGLRGPAASADLNGDSVITIDELVTHLTAVSGAAASPSGERGREENRGRNRDRDDDRDRDENRRRDENRGRGENRGRDGDRSRDESHERDEDRGREGNRNRRSGGDEVPSRVITNSARATYRFTPARERLPAALPSFFSRDANGDGQIEMSEFASFWTERTVAEFQRYDRNGDGIITAEEAARDN